MNLKRKQRLLNILRTEVVGCYNCQPWDEGAPFWIGPQKVIGDILESEVISDTEWDELLKEFRCPQCGTDLNSPFDDVEVKSIIDRETEKIFHRLKDKRTTNSLKRFNDFLASYPYLGYRNALGRRLFEAIKKGKKASITSKIWYRARLVNQESRVYRSDEMGAPDPNKVFVREGRFNHTGQVFLYLANYEETAHREIVNTAENLTVVQKYKIESITKLLDLRKDYNEIDSDANLLFLAVIYNGYVDRIPNKISSWKPEYFVTRYLADVARVLKFNGIIYSSTAHFGDNIVLFNPKQKGIRTLDKPYIYSAMESINKEEIT